MNSSLQSIASFFELIVNHQNSIGVIGIGHGPANRALARSARGLQLVEKLDLRLLMDKRLNEKMAMDAF